MRHGTHDGDTFQMKFWSIGIDRTDSGDRVNAHAVDNAVQTIKPIS